MLAVEGLLVLGGLIVGCLAVIIIIGIASVN